MCGRVSAAVMDGARLFLAAAVVALVVDVVVVERMALSTTPKADPGAARAARVRTPDVPSRETDAEGDTLARPSPVTDDTTAADVSAVAAIRGVRTFGTAPASPTTECSRS